MATLGVCLGLSFLIGAAAVTVINGDMSVTGHLSTAGASCKGKLTAKTLVVEGDIASPTIDAIHEFIKSLHEELQTAKKEAIEVNQRIEWQICSTEPNHPRDGTKKLTVEFKGEVVEAVPVLMGFLYNFDGNREDHSVGGIAAKAFPEVSLEGRKVTVTVDAKLYDFAEHVSHKGEIQILVIARTKP